jgi:hypothetical protein
MKWTTQTCTHKYRIEAHSRNHYCSEKTMSITYSECVPLAFVIQHENRMDCIILSSVACLAVPYSSTLSHKRHDFRKKVVEYKMYVLIFSTNLYEIFLILRIQRGTTTNTHKSSYDVPVVLLKF